MEGRRFSLLSAFREIKKNEQVFAPCDIPQTGFRVARTIRDQGSSHANAGIPSVSERPRRIVQRLKRTCLDRLRRLSDNC
jgi:molybdopterin-guanine dinucleotide biosynthesis protein A